MKTQPAKARGKSREEREREILDKFGRLPEPMQRAVLCLFEKAYSHKHEGRTK